MKASTCMSILIAVYTLLIDVVRIGFGDALEREAIAVHHDQLQNLQVECEEVRAYDIDPAVAAKEPLNFRQVQLELKRTEASTLTFQFLNGSAYYDRTTAGSTLSYWAAKGLPAIARQTQIISATGRMEELTTQVLANGKKASFGGLRQLSEFSPDVTIDIALGLRLLANRQWLNKDDLGAMEEVPQNDPSIVILHALDGSGHLHEMRFDKRLLYAMVYYRCTGTRGSYVEIMNSDFHRYGNVFIPGRMIRNSNVVDSKGQTRHPLTFTLTVRRVSLNDPNNTAARYVIAWPAHLHLFDARTNDQIEIGPTTRPLSDDDIRQQIAERRIREAMLEALAAQRVHRALDGEPTTRP
ncbi:MAG: hypothetical protein ABSB74_17465 [Tepidisphaeraceae bacterium]